MAGRRRGTDRPRAIGDAAGTASCRRIARPTQDAKARRVSIDLSMAILVVDDFATMSRIMRGLLHQIGFQSVDAVCGGASALEKLRTGKYRLIISDWNMEP